MKELTKEEEAQFRAEQEKRAAEASARVHAETEAYRAKITEPCPFCDSNDLRVGNEISGASWPARPIQCMKCGIKISDDWDEPLRWNNRPAVLRAWSIKTALQGLVDLKDLKERIENGPWPSHAEREAAIANYENSKPDAWAVARAVLKLK